MTLVRVSVSARCAIPVDGKLLLYTNRKSIRRGTPALWPFGGGIATTDEGRQELMAEYEAVQFEGGRGEDDPNDLRFKLPQAQLARFEKWLRRNEPRLPIADSAARELSEEAERHDLPLDVAEEIRFGSFKRVDQLRSDWSYLTKPVVEVESRCYDYIVQGLVPTQAVGRRIEELVAASPILQLVNPIDIRRGHLSDGTQIPEMCKLLL